MNFRLILPIIFVFLQPIQIDGEPPKCHEIAAMENRPVCNATTSDGIGLFNVLRPCCEAKVSYEGPCSRFMSVVHPGNIRDACGTKNRKNLATCINRCSETVRKILCKYWLSEVTRINGASTDSASWRTTEHNIQILEKKKHIYICGEGTPGKLKKFKERETVLLGYRQACHDNLANQCKSASHDKEAVIPGSCADGGVDLERSESLLNDLRRFCVWHGYLPPNKRENERVCHDCSNFRVGCQRKSC